MTGPTLWDEGTHLPTDLQTIQIKVAQWVTKSPTLYPSRTISGPWTQLSCIYTKSGILWVSWKQQVAETLFKGRKKEPETLFDLGVTQSACWRRAGTPSWAKGLLSHHQLDNIPEDITTAPLTSSEKKKREGGKEGGRETKRGNRALITRWHLE